MTTTRCLIKWSDNKMAWKPTNQNRYDLSFNSNFHSEFAICYFCTWTAYLKSKSNQIKPSLKKKIARQTNKQTSFAVQHIIGNFCISIDLHKHDRMKQNAPKKTANFFLHANQVK